MVDQNLEQNTESTMSYLAAMAARRDAGFAASTGKVIVMRDADGSADPAAVSAFVDALVAGADLRDEPAVPDELHRPVPGPPSSATAGSGEQPEHLA